MSEALAPIVPSEAVWPGARHGFFGKVPQRGDFVVRNLPRDFVDVWDRWLHDELGTLQAAKGEAWVEPYLHAPSWRFALAPGVAGALGALGVVTPSVDHVGRYYPLTIAACIADLSPVVAMLVGDAWCGVAEELSHLALDPATSFEMLSEGVDALIAPPAFPRPLVESDESGIWLRLSPEATLALAVVARLENRSSAPRVVFWTHGNAAVQPAAAQLDELPRGRWFAALWSGVLDAGPGSRVEPTLFEKIA